MKPLTILLGLWLAGSGALVTQAQVYQVNIVGYISVSVPSGLSLIANPLNNGANTVSDVLTNGVVDGMVLYKLDATAQTFSVNLHQAGFWSNPTETLAPGEGAFLFSPSPAALTFVGSFNTGPQTNSLPAGLSLVGSMFPLSGRLDTLEFPVANGDIIYRFDNASSAYKVYTYDFGSWTTPPVLNLGESFFVWKAAATNWVETFSF